MPQGRLLFSLIAAAAIALLGLLLTGGDEEAADPATTPQAERPDFFLEDFEMVAYDSGGQRHGTLQGRLGEHFPQRGELEIHAPEMTLRSREGINWRARAPLGIAHREQEWIELRDEVTIRRPATAERPPLEIETRQLRFDTAAGKARTEAPVTAREPLGTLRGTGMTLDYLGDRLRLHADVRGTYELR